MRDNQPIFIVLFFLFCDLAFMNMIYWSFADIYSDESLNSHIYAALVFNIMWLVVERSLYIYDVRYLILAEGIVTTLFNSCCVHVVLSIFVLFTIKFQISRIFIFQFYTTFVIAAMIFRFGTRFILRHISKGGYSYKNIAVIGGNKEGHFLQNHVQSDNTFGVNFLGFIADSNHFSNCSESDYILGDIESIDSILQQQKIDEIYWALPLDNEGQIRKVIRLCDKYMIRFHTIPQFLASPFKNLSVYGHSGIPMMHLREEPLEHLTSRCIKRTFDIVFSLLVTLFILCWLIPLIAIIIKLTSKGPVFFSQRRTGKNNQDFMMLKFRSMNMTNANESKQATKNDSRVYPFGAFLRKSSLDEMPQFINCLMGDMSVVGPRPHMLKHTEDYSNQINDFMVRHYLKSGITGWAQINGARGETKTLQEMKNRVDLDIWYLEHWTLLLDLKICFKTAFNVVLNRDKSY